jgi:hypothetical protein
MAFALLRNWFARSGHDLGGLRQRGERQRRKQKCCENETGKTGGGAGHGEKILNAVQWLYVMKVGPPVPRRCDLWHGAGRRGGRATFAGQAQRSAEICLRNGVGAP